MGKVACFLFLILSCAAACAQSLPEVPSHRFWDTSNRMLFAVDATVKTADFVATHHNLTHGGVELNPLARPLCTKGTAGQTVFFEGQSLAAVGVSYLLHRAGHHRLERMFTIGNIADSAYGAAYSFSHR